MIENNLVNSLLQTPETAVEMTMYAKSEQICRYKFASADNCHHQRPLWMALIERRYIMPRKMMKN
jgi:hypothetical protein